MKTFKKALISGLALTALFLSFGGSAHAATPYYTLTSVGGDSVQMNITADPNATITFYYNTTSGPVMFNRTLGTTDANGHYTAVISTSSYSITPGGNTYIIVNNQQSAMVAWPYVSSNGTLSLSQSSLSLSVGQSATVTAYTSGTAYTFLSNNSNSSIASVTASGSQITVYGNSIGSTTASICLSNSVSTCVNLSITVQNNGTNGGLTFSQSNVTLNTGQTNSVTVYGGSGSYYVSNNTNPNLVQVSLSGSNVSLYGNSGSGSSSVTICSSNVSTCGTLYVTLNGGSSGGSVTFSQSNIFMTSGQNQTVTIYGNGGYTMSNNSNPTAVSIILNGSTATIYGLSTGSATISICQTSGGCGTLTVVVNGAGNNVPTFSQTNPVVNTGQSVTVTIYGGSTSYYIGSNSNPTVAQPNISGSTLTIYGGASGTSNISICSTTSSCATVFVTVNTSTGNPITFSQNNPSLTVGQILNISLFGSTGSYYLQSVPTNLFQASINGNTLTLTGVAQGSSSMSVCASGNSCSNLYVSVTGTGGSGSVTFSQSSVSLSVGQSLTVSIYGNGGYYLSGNQSTNIVTTEINGSNAVLVGTNPGSVIVTICQTGGQCGAINVQVSGTNGGSITFSQSSLSFNGTSGQTQTISIYGSGSYYVSNNSNSSVATATVSGNSLVVTSGSVTGTTTMSICQSGGACGTLVVTNGTGGTGAVTFSQSSLNFSNIVGQTQTVTIYGSGSYYVSNNSNPSVAYASISGNTALVTSGSQSGSTVMSICQSGGQCGTLYVQVGSGNGSGSVTFSQSNVSFNGGAGQTQTVSIYGNGGYYISNNSNPSAGYVTISGNSAVITSGSVTGTTTVTICQTGGSSCGTLYVSSVVNTPLPPVYVPPVTTPTAPGYYFRRSLLLGSRGSDVTELQNMLRSFGFFSGSSTGYYGAATKAAVKRYQSRHGVSPIGNVGPATRALLNKGE